MFSLSRVANDKIFFFPKSETSEDTILNRMLHSLNKSLLNFTGLANDPFRKSTSLDGHKEQMTLLILFSTLQWIDPKNNRRNRVDFIVVFNQYQTKVGIDRFVSLATINHGLLNRLFMHKHIEYTTS